MMIKELVDFTYFQLELSGDYRQVYRSKRLQFWLEVLFAPFAAMIVTLTIAEHVNLGTEVLALTFSVLAIVLLYPKYTYDTSPQSPGEVRRQLAVEIIGGIVLDSYDKELPEGGIPQEGHAEGADTDA
jgi:hypothetical protein